MWFVRGFPDSKKQKQNAHQRSSGKGEPKNGQSRKVRLFSMTFISLFLVPSILGGMSTGKGKSITPPEHFIAYTDLQGL